MSDLIVIAIIIIIIVTIIIIIIIKSDKTTDLLKEDSCSFAQDILSFAQGNSKSSQRSVGDDGLAWIPRSTVYL